MLAAANCRPLHRPRGCGNSSPRLKTRLEVLRRSARTGLARRRRRRRQPLDSGRRRRIRDCTRRGKRALPIRRFLWVPNRLGPHWWRALQISGSKSRWARMEVPQTNRKKGMLRHTQGRGHDETASHSPRRDSATNVPEVDLRSAQLADEDRGVDHRRGVRAPR
jgi:hypothetical protein